MAINSNIALGVQPIQLADPMSQYAKIAAIQGAQNQNALAQYQLSSAKRADETQNLLARAYSESVDPATGKIDYNKLTGLVAAAGGGAQLPAIQKSRLEQETALTAQQKAQAELVDAKLKQSRGFLETINPADPNAPAQYIAWHEANHKDPVLGPVLTARGITAEQSRARIADAINKGPAAFAQLLNQSKLGTEKFMELNKPQLSTKDTGSQLIDRTFEPLTGKITNLGTTAKTMTPGEVASNIVAQGQLKVARDRLAQEGQGVTYVQGADNTYVALPNKIKAGDVPTARPVIASGGGLRLLEGKPSDLVGKEQLSINQQKSIVQGAIDATKATPDAFGWTTGNMPEGLRARMASGDENENRAFVFNVVSGVIKERAGTAQTAGEAATLRRFLPDETDSATIIEEKLKGFQKYLDAREAGTTKKRGGGGGNNEKPPLSAIDQQALQWANSNPADPRAAAIKQRLGM